MNLRESVLTFLFSFLLAGLTIASNDSPFARYPALNSDGSEIAFVYQGDIWKVPSDGGTAIRLTVNKAYDGVPQWNRDDSLIAFSSNRWGNNDLFVMNSDGTGIKRITYNSAGDNLNQWSADNSLLFSTRRTFRQVEWEAEVYSASPDGGTPERILDATGFMPVKSPDGKFIAFVKGPCRISREAYKGSANKDLWIYDIAKGSFKKLTTYEGNDFYPRWGDNSTLYFISSRNGVYNIFRMTLEDNKAKTDVVPVTEFSEDGIRYFSVSADGKHAAFERGTDIYILSLTDGEYHKVKIDAASDYKFDPFEHKKFSNGINDYVVSPNGKYSAIEIHGEIFVTENDKEKKLTANISNNPYRDQNPQWLNDSTLIFVSDRNGQKDLFMATSANEKESNLLKCLEYKITKIAGAPEEEDYPLISHDGKKIAYQIGRGKFVTADIDAEGKLTNEVTLLDGWAAPQNPAWSPDSRWIAYAIDDLDFNTEIFIRKADGTNEPVNVSMHPRSDTHPVWSPDGSKLAFVSDRNNRNNDIWFVWLKTKDWEKTKQDWTESGDEPQKEKKKKKDDEEKKDSQKVKEIKIDTENIWRRLVQVTSMAGDETSPSFSKDGKTIFFVTSEPATKGRDLYKIKFDGTDIKRITKGGKNPYALSSAEKGKYLYMLTKGGKLSRLKNGSDKLENVAFSAKMTIDYNAELNQIFEEAWRALRDGFYDPRFHGQDWLKLKNIYKPMAMKASTKKDFRDMFNIMLGQINASHMGLYGKDRPKTQKEKTGLLGIEAKPVNDGIVVERVIPKSPAYRDTSKLNAGDKIVSVNGTPVNAGDNFYAPLVNASGERVLLKVKNKTGEERTVVIRPTVSLSSQLYDEWVESERKLTDEYSGGRLGYLHIKAMGWPSFERFERELAAAGYGKDGIVIDVRYNGGGWTTDYLMTVLNYKQHAYTIPRGATKDLQKDHLKFRDYYPYAERLPYAVWTKPSIAMCNESSYSNAEIFSHAYKTLGIGKLVGVSTFGAVISTGGHGLMDGSYVRLPFRGWFVKATDENMEFGPAVPQFIVENTPDSKAKGKDEQLKKAVDELLKELK